MTPQQIADSVIVALDQASKGRKEGVEYIYAHPGSFDVQLFGQVTKLLIAHYRGKGWGNVEIGRVTTRDGHSFIAFQLSPGA